MRVALATPRPGELRGAEVADDRRVGQQEERLGDEREERGDGQPQDLPALRGIGGRSAHRATLSSEGQRAATGVVR